MFYIKVWHKTSPANIYFTLLLCFSQIIIKYFTYILLKTCKRNIYLLYLFCCYGFCIIIYGSSKSF